MPTVGSQGGAFSYEQGTPVRRNGAAHFLEMGLFAPLSPLFKNVKRVRETEILVEQHPPQGDLVCDYAGLVINDYRICWSCNQWLHLVINDYKILYIRWEPPRLAARVWSAASKVIISSANNYIHNLGFNENCYTLTLMLLIKIVLCSKFPWTNFMNCKWFDTRSLPDEHLWEILGLNEKYYTPRSY